MDAGSQWPYRGRTHNAARTAGDCLPEGTDTLHSGRPPGGIEEERIPVSRVRSKTMPRKIESVPTVIYQIKVTLKDSKPPIWRRIQVRGDVTLAQFHTILQLVMGWGDYHLHAFRLGGMEYGQPEPELRMRSDTSVQLTQPIPAE